MIELIEQNIEPLRQLCDKYHVAHLSIFGSGTTEQFDPDQSDLDFLVSFKPLKSNEYADTYFGLSEDLEKLFCRPIDLVMEKAITNPYFRQSVQDTRMTLYDAA